MSGTTKADQKIIIIRMGFELLDDDAKDEWYEWMKDRIVESEGLPISKGYKEIYEAVMEYPYIPD